MFSGSRILLGVLALLVLTGAVVYFQQRDPEPKPTPPIVPLVAPGPGAASLRETFQTELKEAGWSDEAARQVAGVHAEWFEALVEEQPAHATIQRTYLKELGKYPQLMPLLETHPEVAGLLAAADDPQPIARTLREAGNDYDLVAALYMQHAAPEDAALLAQALLRHRELIARLIRRGVFGAELVFLFNRKGAGAEEYSRWLHEELSARLGNEDDDLAAFQVFLLDEGVVLRKRMKEDAGFRDRFRTELWPNLARIAEPTGGWTLYTAEPHLWDLLALSEGEELLSKHGRLPIQLLFDQGHYPAALHGQVLAALKTNDEQLLQGLAYFREEPLFHKLLLRELPQPVMESAIKRLFRAGNGATRDLALFERLSDSALMDELGPPPSGIVTWIPLSSTFYLGKKLLQGREASATDWILGVADPALMFLPGGKAAGQVGKEVTTQAASGTFKTVLKTQGMEYAKKQFAREAAKTGSKIGAAEVAGIVTRMAAKGLEGELYHFGVTGFLGKMQAPLRKALTQGLARVSTFEITSAVRLVFKHSGLSARTFRRLTGLEARLFMGAEARVFISLERPLLGKLKEKFFEEVNERVADAASDHLQSWRRNASAWWMLNVSGMGDS